MGDCYGVARDQCCLYHREASSSEAGEWEDKVELSSGVPSQKETGQSRAEFPRHPMRDCTLPGPELGTSGTPRMAT